MNRIQRVIGRFQNDRRGLLTFEWILLISLLVIGVIGGLGAVRNALICELFELAECIESIDFCDDDGEPCVCDINDPNCCMDGGNVGGNFPQGNNGFPQGGPPQNHNDDGHPHHTHKAGHGHAPGTPAPSKEHPHDD